MKKMIILTILLIILKSLLSQTYTVTVYNPVPNQCNRNHLITADGSFINMQKLEEGTIKWVAVSRDMLKDFKYGDKIEIISSDPLISGIYEIHDTMNKRFKKRIDILMPEKIKTGKWTVKIRKIKKT
jgi:3D (Asp-Asp-Asp) domain-containing protein